MSQMSVNMEICDGMNLVERAIKKALIPYLLYWV